MRAVVLVRAETSKKAMRTIVQSDQSCDGQPQWSILPLRACDAERAGWGIQLTSGLGLCENGPSKAAGV